MIYVGYCAFATVLGFLLGASNTPVVGAFLTALIGLIGTVVTATKLAGESHGTTNIGSFVGKTLTVFAVGTGSSGSKIRIAPCRGEVFLRPPIHTKLLIG
jgi:hypothetical protein